MSEPFCVVVLGHVDHGKSTLLGRLLADTGSLPSGKLEGLRNVCAKRGVPFEYAYLLDAFREEQSQGITIDAARLFFHTHRRRYTLVDVPGHTEFLKNMVTGAARADAALLVIDANDGLKENTKKHARLVSLLGIKEVCLVVNKMDLVHFSQRSFLNIVETVEQFLKTSVNAIPVSAIEGDNVVERSNRMEWYHGGTLLERLERLRPQLSEPSLPLRMPIQGLLRLVENHSNKRLILGTVASGKLNPGDPITLSPSGQRSRVKTVERFLSPDKGAEAGEAIGLTLEDELYIRRGEVLCRSDERVCLSSRRIDVSLFWLGKEPMVFGKTYLLKLGTAKTLVELEEISGVSQDESEEKGLDGIPTNALAKCRLRLDDAIAVELAAQHPSLGRFVVVDNFHIVAGGIILAALEDASSADRSRVMARNQHWEHSYISREERMARYQQVPTLILITGAKERDRKSIGKALEAALFKEGKAVSYFGMANLLHGMDSDLERGGWNSGEHIRRLGELSHVMLEAGLLFIITVAALGREEIESLRTRVGRESFHLVWVGEDSPLSAHVNIGQECVSAATDKIILSLRERGSLFPTR